MSSYAELHLQGQHGQETGLLPADIRQGYAGRYLQQQAETASRRPSPSERRRAVYASPDASFGPAQSPRAERQQDGYAALAPGAVAQDSGTGHVPIGYSSPARHAGGTSALGRRSPSPSPPRQRLDPSVSRPATTVLAQAAAMRTARLKQLAQRQQRSGPDGTALRSGRAPVLLSAVLQQAPHLYDRQRLSAVERFVDGIDALPVRYTDAQVVFLSKNSLTSVSGLEQFGQLRVLSLADNLLADLQILETLAVACPYLEALSLEGNPLSFVPHYRPRVLLALPGLKSLDGRPVTDEERAAAPAALATEEAIMAVLLRNACEVHKMASVVQRAQLHMELLHVMHSRGAVMRRVDALEAAAGGPGARRLARLVEMWDYEGGLGDEERRKIQGALLREVGRMYRQLKVQQQPEQAGGRAKPGWEEAFAQVMTAQQQTTAALLDLMTQCQTAMEELLRGMAATAAHGPPSPGQGAGRDGRGFAAAGGGGEGRGLRARLLHDAEADAQRLREMRQEREDVIAEFRDAALKLSRSSPLRPAQRPVLKSALKRSSSIRESADLGGSVGGNVAGGAAPSNTTGSPSPPRWQSARSSPPSRETVERLSRARRGVLPARTGASGHDDDALGPQAQPLRPRSAPPARGQQGLRRSEAEPAGSGSLHGARSMSVERARPGLQRGAQLRGRAGPGTGLLSTIAANRRSQDSASLRRGASLGSVPAAGVQRRVQRSVSNSPEKVPQSPSAPLQQPVWRPAGTGARSAPSSPDYKDAARAVTRIARAQQARIQAEAGTSPNHSTMTVGAAAAAAGYDPLSSPTLHSGRRHTGGVAALRSTSPSSWAAAPAAQRQPHGTQAHAWQSLQGSPTRHAGAADVSLRRSLQEPGLHGLSGSSLRSSSPAAPWGSVGGGLGAGSRPASSGAGVGARVAVSRIDDLRREVEASARETARLRQIAEIASLPLPTRALPIPSAESPSASPHPFTDYGPSATASPPPMPQPWPIAYAAHSTAAPIGAGARAPTPLAVPMTASQGAFMRQQWPASWPTASSAQAPFQSQPQGAPSATATSLGGLMGPGSPGRGFGTMSANLTFRPPHWDAGGPAASPQPQPQPRPAYLQPHRSVSSGSRSTPPVAFGGDMQSPYAAAGIPVGGPVMGMGAGVPGPYAEPSGLGSLTVPVPHPQPAQLRARAGESGSSLGDSISSSGVDQSVTIARGQQPQLSAHRPEGHHFSPAQPGQEQQWQDTWMESMGGMSTEPSFAHPSQPQPTQAVNGMQLRLQPPPGAAFQPMQATRGNAGMGQAPPEPFFPYEQQQRPFDGSAPSAGESQPTYATSATPQPPAPDANPSTLDGYETPQHPLQPSGGPGDQVTLGDFSAMRASLDVLAPGSAHPSVAGTPRRSHAAPIPTATGLFRDGLLDVYAPPSSFPDGPSGPGTRTATATPAFTPLAAATRDAAMAPAAATPGGATVVSVVEDADGSGARVEVEELLQEDSAGYKDQHIHVHIHATPTLQAPDTTTTASTPQLFLQPASEPQRPAPSASTPLSLPVAAPADSSATALSILAPPGSPLHEGLASGRLVYEKIERIKPSGHEDSAEGPEATTRDADLAKRRAEARAEERSHEGRSARKAARRRAGTPGQPRHEGTAHDRRRRDEQPGFGYDQHAERSARDVRSEDAVDASHGTDDEDVSESYGEGQGSWRVRSGSQGREEAGGTGRSPGRRSGVKHSGRDYSDDDVEYGGSGRLGDSEQYYSEGGGSTRRSGARPGRRAGQRRRVASGSRRQDQGGPVPDGQQARFGAHMHPELQQQYEALQQELAEQRSLSAHLAAQLQNLQNRVHVHDEEAVSADQQPQGRALETAGAYRAGPVGTTSSGSPTIPAFTGSDRDGSNGQGGNAYQQEQSHTPSRRRPITADALPAYQLGPTPASQQPIGGVSADPNAASNRSPAASPRATSGSSPPPHSIVSVSPSGLRPVVNSPLAGAVPAGVLRSPEPAMQQEVAEHLRGLAEEVREQAVRNRELQEGIAKLETQLAGGGGFFAGLRPEQIPEEVATALAGLAATTAPLPPGSLRALEQHLVSMTLEREAVERALLAEQAEVRLLQQELGVMGHVAEALQEAHAQLQETRLAVVHQQQELQDRDEQLAASSQRVAELEAQLAAERERAAAELAETISRYERELDDVRTAAATELREQTQMAAAAAAQAAQAAADSAMRAVHASQLERLRAQHVAELEALLAERDAQLRAAPDTVERASQVIPLYAEQGTQLEPTPGPLTVHRASQVAVLLAEHATQAESPRAVNRSSQAFPLQTEQSTQSGLHLSLRTASSGVQTFTRLLEQGTQLDPQPSIRTADYAAQVSALFAEQGTQLEPQPAPRTANYGTQVTTRFAEQGTQLEAQIAIQTAEYGTQASTRSIEQGTQLEPQPVTRTADYGTQASVRFAEHGTQLEPLPTARTAEYGTQVSTRFAEQGTQLEPLPATRTVDYGTQMSVRFAEQGIQLEPQPATRTADYGTQVSVRFAEHGTQLQQQAPARTTSFGTQVSARSTEQGTQPALRLHPRTVDYATQVSTRSTEQGSQHEPRLYPRTADYGTQASGRSTEQGTQPEPRPYPRTAEYGTQVSGRSTEQGTQAELRPTPFTAERAAQISAPQPEPVPSLRSRLSRLTDRAERAAQLAALRAEQSSQLEALHSLHREQERALRSISPETSAIEQLEAILSDRSLQSLLYRRTTDSATQVAAASSERATQFNPQPIRRTVSSATQVADTRVQQGTQMEAPRASNAAVQAQGMRSRLTTEDSIAHSAAAAQQLEALRASQAAQLDALRAVHAAQLTNLCSEHAAQLQALSADHAAFVDNLRSSHASQLETVHANHQAELGALRSDHAKEVEAELGTMRSDHAKEVEAQRTELAAARAEQEALRAAVQKAAEVHEQQLASMRSKHEHQVQELTTTHEAALRNQEADHKAKLSSLAVELRAQLDACARRLDDVMAEHRQQLQELEDRHEMELSAAVREGQEELAAAVAAAEAAAAEATRVHGQEVAVLMERLSAAERAAEAAAEAADAATERAELERHEAEAVRAALHDQLEEARELLGRERVTAQELQEMCHRLELAVVEARAEHEDFKEHLGAARHREAVAEQRSGRCLVRRVLVHWALNAGRSRAERLMSEEAAKHHNMRLCRRALRHWRVALLRTRVLHSMLRSRAAALMRRVLFGLKSQVLQHRRKTRGLSIASSHCAWRLLARSFVGWRQLHRAYTRAATHHDPESERKAVAHHVITVLGASLAAWYRYVHDHRLPKTHRWRRAIHANKRSLLRRAMAALAYQVERRGYKRTQLIRSDRRYRFSVLTRALSRWLGFVERARRKRTMRSAAELQYAHNVVQRWRHAAVRSKELRRGVEALQAGSSTRRMRAYFARWRAFLLRRRQSALAERLAVEHHRGSLLWRCLSAWLQLAQAAAARQLHIKGMREYQRMMQAALRWQRMVELSQRQRAVVDRAVRLYRHRVLAATQRAVLTHWRALVEGRRERMRSAAIGFVHAFLSFQARRILTAWHSLARGNSAVRGRLAVSDLKSRLEGTESALRRACNRLEEVITESASLTERLKEAQSDVLVLRQQLGEVEVQLAEKSSALAEAQESLKSRGSALASCLADVDTLAAERDLLQQRVDSLRQQVHAGEMSVSSLEEQAAALQRSLVAAQDHARELGLQMQQQAASYEEQLLAARDEAALARREAGSMAATAARFEQQAADGETQLRAVRAANESLVATLRQELRARDAHIAALSQQQEQAKAEASALPREPSLPARPAAQRPPSPSWGGQRPWSKAVAWRDASANDVSAGGALGDDVESSSGTTSSGSADRQPLFEPSSRTAAALQQGERPWSAGLQRQGSAPALFGGPSASSLRTSLLSQPLLSARAARPEPVTTPPPPPEDDDTETDIWTRSPVAASTPRAATRPPVPLPRPSMSSLRQSGQGPLELAAAAAQNSLRPRPAEDARRLQGAGPVAAEAALAAAAAEATAQMLQSAAEAERQASEDEFQRRRARILGSVAVTRQPEIAAAPQQSRQPEPPSAETSAISSVQEAGVRSAEDMSRFASRLSSDPGMPPLRDAADATLAGVSAASAARADQTPSHLRSSDSGSEVERTLRVAAQLMYRPDTSAPTRPSRSSFDGVGLSGASTAAGSAATTAGGAQQSPRGSSAAGAAMQSELPVLTAGIVDTLSSLREAMRAQQPLPQQLSSWSLAPQASLPGSSVSGDDGQGSIGTGPASHGGAGDDGAAAAHRTFTLRPSLNDSLLAPGSSGSLTTASSGTAEATLRDMLPGGAARPPLATQGSMPRRSSADGTAWALRGSDSGTSRPQLAGAVSLSRSWTSQPVGTLSAEGSET